MTLKNLSEQIIANPDQATELLRSFKSEDTRVSDFISTLINVPVYIVPGLIAAFAGKYRDNEPKTVSDLTLSKSYVGSMFADEDGQGYTFLGVNRDGEAMCRADNSMLVIELNKDIKIKWVF